MVLHLSIFFQLASIFNILCCSLSASIIHTVDQLCDIFSLFSPPSLWHLLNLLGVYWCNNWCLHSPTPPLLSGAPHASTQWIHLHPHYRTNCHAGRKANQILRQQLGEEIAFPLSGRKASTSSLCPRFYRRDKSKWRKGESCWAAAAGLQASRRSSLTHFLPSSPSLSLPLHSLSTSLPTHFDTTYQSRRDTGDYIPPSSLLDETEQ